MKASWSSHSGLAHRKLRSVAWHLACCLRCSDVLNALPHPSCAHLNGFSVPCVARCFSNRARPWFVTKSHPGTGHARRRILSCG